MTLRVIWKVLKSFMDASTQKQMFVYGSSYKKELLELIDEDKLEKKFGGTFPNMESDFYPPNLS